jgi:hypothetical protein
LSAAVIFLTKNLRRKPDFFVGGNRAALSKNLLGFSVLSGR